MVLVTLGKACLLHYICALADPPVHPCIPPNAPGGVGGTDWGRRREAAEPVPSHGSLGDSAGDAKELTAVPGLGAFIPAPLWRVCEGSESG